MLAHRVIPSLLMRGDELVKGSRFNGWRTVGVVEQAVRVHQARGVDELILLDIAATPEGRGPDLQAVERLTDCCFSPITVGGGVRTVEDARDLFLAGADKVAVCSAAFLYGEAVTPLIRQIAGRFGCQAIVAALDCVDGRAVSRCGTVRMSWGVAEIAQRWANEGAGEILLTSIDREGTMQGYDLDLIRSVSAAVSIPVIAHGGCGSYEHMAQAIEAGASAVAAGAFFQFEDATPAEAARYLRGRGIEARV